MPVANFSFCCPPNAYNLFYAVLSFIVPNTEIMEKNAGKVMEEFKSLVFPLGYDPMAGKRKVIKLCRCRFHLVFFQILSSVVRFRDLLAPNA